MQKYVFRPLCKKQQQCQPPKMSCGKKKEGSNYFTASTVVSRFAGLFAKNEALLALCHCAYLAMIISGRGA